MSKPIRVGEFQGYWAIDITPGSYMISLEFTRLPEGKESDLPWKKLPSKKVKEETVEVSENPTTRPPTVSPEFMKLWGLDKPAPCNESTPLATDVPNKMHKEDKTHLDNLILEIEPPGYANILGFIEADDMEYLELVERGIKVEAAYRIISRALGIEYQEIARVLNAAVEALHTDGSDDALQAEYILRSGVYNPWMNAESR